VKHQVKKVVICNFDPFPLVAGKGIEKLQNAGIEVVTGVLEEQGRRLNTRFFTVVEKKRPYIILKWAETADGFIAGENFEQIKISNALSHKLSHKWRSEEDAIMVGTNTALHDNPKLNVREWTGKNPTRIVLDKKHRLPQDLYLFDASQKTYVISSIDELKGSWGAIQSLIVEGGTKLLQSFIDENLFDEIRFFRSNNQLKKGILAPVLPKNINLVEVKHLMGDELSFYMND
jgi:diaminohydroxyphosphoribosylaminopyrimidine deaminase/5-amino-6-(5-phosphoribosylamino)uracil reductase